VFGNKRFFVPPYVYDDVKGLKIKEGAFTSSPQINKIIQDDQKE